MIKGGEDKYNSLTGNSSYSEYFACQVAKALGIKWYTKYLLTEKEDVNGKRAFTTCRLFTDEDIGYLGIGDTKYKNLSIREVYRLMSSLGNSMEFREMLLLDSLIYNIDRHKWNYGFLIDTNTYNIVKMAPIFDNNLAFLGRVSIKDDDEEIIRQLKIQRPSTYPEYSFARQGRLAIDGKDELRNRLSNIQDFKFNREGIKYLEPERMDFMDTLVKNQIQLILK